MRFQCIQPTLRHGSRLSQLVWRSDSVALSKKKHEKPPPQNSFSPTPSPPFFLEYKGHTCEVYLVLGTQLRDTPR